MRAAARRPFRGAKLPGVWQRVLLQLRPRDRIAGLLSLVRHVTHSTAFGLDGRSTMGSMGRVFRQLLEDEPYLFTGGIYSPLDAQIAERAGMKSIYLSGYSVAMLNGWPDMGLLTMTEVAKTASMVASAVEVPIIADADDGYGNALSTMRTV